MGLGNQEVNEWMMNDESGEYDDDAVLLMNGLDIRGKFALLFQFRWLYLSAKRLLCL